MARSLITEKKPARFIGCECCYFVDGEGRRQYDPTSKRGILVGYCDYGYQVIDYEQLADQGASRVSAHGTRGVPCRGNVFPARGLNVGPRAFQNWAAWLRACISPQETAGAWRTATHWLRHPSVTVKARVNHLCFYNCWALLPHKYKRVANIKSRLTGGAIHS